jgi:hypothetical protein
LKYSLARHRRMIRCAAKTRGAHGYPQASLFDPK